MTPGQCRMARAALRWSTRDLAREASVGVNTVSRFETGENAHDSTIRLMRTTLEAAGIIFIEADETAGPGVRLRDPHWR